MSDLSSILSSLLSNPSTASVAGNVIAALGQHLSTSSSVQTSVNALLTQLQANPANATQVAAQIAAIPGVPASVLALVNEIPQAASDRIALTELIVQIEAIYGTLNSTSTLGRILSSAT